MNKALIFLTYLGIATVTGAVVKAYMETTGRGGDLIEKTIFSALAGLLWPITSMFLGIHFGSKAIEKIFENVKK